MPAMRSCSQDCRGRHDSDGVWDPYMCELTDGFDTHEWVGRQPWCDGQVATFGVSYPGFTQTLPAIAPQPAPEGAGADRVAAGQLGPHPRVGRDPLERRPFFATMIGRTHAVRSPWRSSSQDALLRHLPLVDDRRGRVGLQIDFFRGVIEHDRYDEWWSRYSLRDRYGEVDVPAYFMTGWYDSLLRETLTVFSGLEARRRDPEARRLTRHPRRAVEPPGRAVGRVDPIGPNGEFDDVAFGAHAVGDNIARAPALVRRAASGAVDTGIDDEPPVRLFVMGRNEWRGEAEWPLARTAVDRRVPAARRAALVRSLRPTASCARPLHLRPRPTRFRRWVRSTRRSTSPGRATGAAIEERPDVLTYTSDVLDARPRGDGSDRRRALGCDRRARHGLDRRPRRRLPRRPRDHPVRGDLPRSAIATSWRAPTLVPPDTPTAYPDRLLGRRPTSSSPATGSGSRSRSSNFPRFDRNLNTGGRDRLRDRVAGRAPDGLPRCRASVAADPAGHPSGAGTSVTAVSSGAPPGRRRPSRRWPPRLAAAGSAARRTGSTRGSPRSSRTGTAGSR